MVNGVITNYKYFEDTKNQEFGHFYEITDSEDNFYYVKVKKLYEETFSRLFGSQVDLVLSSSGISGPGDVFIPTTSDLICGPFRKKLDVINYRGFVLDCIDTDIGVYNLDNEIILFGSGCLELQCGIEVVLYNLHLVPLNDSRNWIYKLFGRTLKSCTHILIYCPSFSSFLLEGSMVYDNFVESRSGFFPLLYTHHWLKEKGGGQEFPGFSALDSLASVLIPKGSADSGKGSTFIGHCTQCTFTDDFLDYSTVISGKKVANCRELKDFFHSTKQSLSDECNLREDNNEIHCKTEISPNEILVGVLTRKSSVMYELASGGTSISIYCTSNLQDCENEQVFIFNSMKIVELVPRLKIHNTFITKAYVWLIPGESKIWSLDGGLRQPSIPVLDGFVQCSLERKYLILQDSIDTQEPSNEMTVLNVNSSRGPWTFHLDAKAKFYSILPSKQITAGAFYRFPSIYIHEKYFHKHDEQGYDFNIITSSSDILTLMECSDSFTTTSGGDGPIKVKVSDIPYLIHVKGIQFFSLKLRFHALSTFSFKLTCSKCKSKVESGKCLMHLEDFSPFVTLNSVFEASDLVDGLNCSVFIDRISDFELILQRKGITKELLNFAKSTGSIKLNSNSLSFKNYFKQEFNVSDPNASITKLFFPLNSTLFTCTFPFSMSNSILRPSNLEKIDTNLEILNVLNYLNRNKK